MKEGKLVKVARWTFISMFIAGPILVALLYVQLFQRIDAKDNATRCKVVGLVNVLAANSERSAKALEQNPASTPAQRAAATKNLSVIKDLKHTTADALGNPRGRECQETP